VGYVNLGKQPTGSSDVELSEKVKGLVSRNVLENCRFLFAALGCPPLKTPEDGYLVDRNATHAQYMCCVGFVFPDTSRRERYLHCENGNVWTTDLPDCISKCLLSAEVRPLDVI
jgi:hypothetical protein